MNLINIFNKISAPSLDDEFQFSAIPVEGFEEHRIAKDKKENPALLLSFNSNTVNQGFKNIKLQNVAVIFDIHCVIRQHNQVYEKKFSAISFTGNDIALRRYFLRLCTVLIEEIGHSPSAEMIKSEISKFIELFRFASEPKKKDVQGLWAELFFILQSKDPSILIKSWHSIPEERLDFNNGEERIEVKSSVSSNRVHDFSLEQLKSPSDTKTIVVSVLVRQVSTGVSILMLHDEICKRIPGQVELIQKLQLLIASTLGNTINDSEIIQFDFQFAIDSMRLYWAEEIPQIEIQHIPKFVTEIHFKADLSCVIPLEISELCNYGSLFKGI